MPQHNRCAVQRSNSRTHKRAQSKDIHIHWFPRVCKQFWRNSCAKHRCQLSHRQYVIPLIATSYPAVIHCIRRGNLLSHLFPANMSHCRFGISCDVVPLVVELYHQSLPRSCTAPLCPAVEIGLATDTLPEDRMHLQTTVHSHHQQHVYKHRTCNYHCTFNKTTTCNNHVPSHQLLQHPLHMHLLMCHMRNLEAFV